MTKRINVVTTAYEGDDFPEAEHYAEYVAAQLTVRYPGFAVDVSEGPATRVTVYGADIDDGSLEKEIGDDVKVAIWDEFCSHGYKAYTRTDTSGRSYIAVAGQDVGTCRALNWAAMSIDPYVLARGEDEDAVRSRAEERAGHDDIHLHQV